MGECCRLLQAADTLTYLLKYFTYYNGPLGASSVFLSGERIAENCIDMCSNQILLNDEDQHIPVVACTSGAKFAVWNCLVIQ